MACLCAKNREFMLQCGMFPLVREGRPFAFPLTLTRCPAHDPTPEAQMSETTQTPEATLAAATTQDALPDARLSLLGTLLGPDMSHALMRIGKSTVTRVTVDDVIDGATVAAIGEGVVMLARAGRTERLSLPAI